MGPSFGGDTASARGVQPHTRHCDATAGLRHNLVFAGIGDYHSTQLHLKSVNVAAHVAAMYKGA